MLKGYTFELMVKLGKLFPFFLLFLHFVHGKIFSDFLLTSSRYFENLSKKQFFPKFFSFFHGIFSRKFHVALLGDEKQKTIYQLNVVGGKDFCVLCFYGVR